ncbi:MAG: Thiosulfate sulfurtransferase [Pseudomonadota bacterium]|jgi:thiosulfate/3-mercaptopyruvate sulfurtransferase
MLRLIRQLTLAAAVGLASPMLVAAPLLEPVDLSAKLANPQVRIVDIRDGKDASGKTPYQNGHVPGSLSAPYSLWRGPADNPGKVPEAARLTEVVQRLGINRETEVVVVYEGKDSTDFGAAARVYWTLKAIGLTKLSILNGGIKGWVAAGKSLTTDAVTVVPSTFVARIDPKFMATREEVERAISGTSKTNLIDARPKDFFEGNAKHAAAKTAGTIQGAKNIEHDTWFAKGSSAMLPPEDIRRIAQQKGIPAGGSADVETVAFCNTGHWAATNWFVQSELLGDTKARLYAESMVDWSRAGLPMSNVPGRLKQLLNEMKM